MPEEENPLDVWFGNQPEEKEKPVEEVELEEETEKIQETTEQETEDDYEAPIKKKEPVVEEEEEPADESAARKRAKVEGKRRKELEAELTEKKLELDRLSTEREEALAKLKEFETTKIKPTDHPDYKELHNEIISDREDFVDNSVAPNADFLSTKFRDLTDTYRALNKDKVKTKEFKNYLTENLYDEGSDFDTLSTEEKRVVNDALLFIKESTKKIDKLWNLENDLEEKSKSGTLAIGVKEYEKSLSEFNPILDGIGDLSDDVIEANPHAIESVVASLAKLPEGKKRLDNAKRDALELITGLRPLTQSEIEKIKTNGGDVKETQALRNKAFQEKKKKLLPMLVQALVTRSTFKEMSEKLAKYEKRKSSEDSEEDALRKISKKKAPVDKVVKEKDPTDIWFSED